MKTRKQYMDKEVSHLAFFSQFVTQSTKDFVLRELTIEQIKNALDSGDKHLNEIKIPFNNRNNGGSWWWDHSPINLELAKELGAVGQNSIPSPSTRTCIGKVAARMLVIENA